MSDIISYEKPEWKRKLRTPRRTWQHIIKNRKEIKWKGVDWIHLVQGRDKWQAIVNTVSPSCSTCAECLGQLRTSETLNDSVPRRRIRAQCPASSALAQCLPEAIYVTQVEVCCGVRSRRSACGLCADTDYFHGQHCSQYAVFLRLKQP